jgi:membrane protein DedA with SNARE-associated domain
MTRWAFTAPAPLVNVLAGTRRDPWRSFLFFDIAGESLWCVTALVPGYLLGEVGELSLPLSMGAGLALSLGGLLLSRAPRLKAMVFDELPLTAEAAVTHHTV